MKSFFFARGKSSANCLSNEKISHQPEEEGIGTSSRNVQELLADLLQQKAFSTEVGSDPSRRSMIIKCNAEHVMTVYSGRDHLEIWLKKSRLPVNEKFLPSIWKEWYLAEARNKTDIQSLKPIIEQALYNTL